MSGFGNYARRAKEIEREHERRRQPLRGAQGGCEQGKGAQEQVRGASHTAV